uniref:hypothetical protein n=1 Tax=Nocardia brasiliensis TaxID=37326 RepID=UPI002455A4E8
MLEDDAAVGGGGGGGAGGAPRPARARRQETGARGEQRRLDAAGFIDPLFSRGMQNTAVVVDRLAERLIDRFRGGFTPETFDDIEQ